MAQMIVNQWGGISDDENLQVGNEGYDVKNIELESIRNINILTNITPINTGFSGTTSSIRGVFVNGNWRLYASTSGGKLENTSGGYTDIPYSVQAVYSLGKENTNYSETTAPLGIRHFWIGDGGIYTTNYDGSGGNFQSFTFGTTGSFNVGDIQRLPDGMLIIAYGNYLFQVNPFTNTPFIANSGSFVLKLDAGSNIWDINIDGGMIWVTFTKGDGNTYIQGIQRSSTSTYTTVSYARKISGKECIGATNSNGVTYWVSTYTINAIQNGGNTELKRLKDRDGTNPYFYNPSNYGKIISENDGYLHIIGPNNTYLYGARGNRNKELVEGGNISACCTYQGQYAINELGYIKYAYRQSSKTTGQYVTMPYTAGQYGYIKKGLGIRVGYQIDKSNGGNIVVKMTTDNIITSTGRDIYNDYVTLVTISDWTKKWIDITPGMITKALGNAGYSEEFSLIKIMFVLNAGTTNKSPYVWDYRITHEDIKND